MTRQEKSLESAKRFLPGFAYAERAVRASGERDLVGTFIGADKSYISVALEFGDDFDAVVSITRSGLPESQFTQVELKQVCAVLGALILAMEYRNGSL